MVRCIVLMVGVWLFVTPGSDVAIELVNSSEEMNSYVETIPGANVTFEMVPIPGGQFLMGSPAGEKNRSEDEGPQHEVAIRPFWMGKTEVTWDEFDKFAFPSGISRKPETRKEPRQAGFDAVTEPTPPYADESFGFGKGRRPVISITHHAAMEYCRWLSATTGKTYRLPTEAEWEYACRAGSSTAYSFGNDPTKLGDCAWYLDNSEEEPHPVALKKSSAWGLHDMHGNVAEWCLDHYEKDFYGRFRAGAAVISPVLLPTERRYPHVARGGSWDDEAGRLRSAARRGSDKSWSKRDPQNPQSIWWHTEAINVGFRVVRPVEEQENLKGLRSKVTRASR